MLKSKWKRFALSALICLMGGAGLIYFPAEGMPTDKLAWQAAARAHAQQMKQYQDLDLGVQATPSVIPRFLETLDKQGILASLHQGGATATQSNAFFKDLGSNGRTCFTCHQPQTGWSISAIDVQNRFKTSNGKDPIFRRIDGTTCPTADMSTTAAKKNAYQLLLNKGLIRIGLPLPYSGALQFTVANVNDPYHCTTNPATGLKSPTTGIVSLYRRPLPSTNLGFLSTLMWDGREPSLVSQALNATLIHAQAGVEPTFNQIKQMVEFESGLFTAQEYSKLAKSLSGAGALGGPKEVAAQLPNFYIGINDPFGGNPKGTPFTSTIFILFDLWETFPGSSNETEHRLSIARGQDLFNNATMNITNVAGMNDTLNKKSFNGTCGTCHNTPTAGSHSYNTLLNMGVADAGTNSPPALDISGLPVFTLNCTEGPLAGTVYTVTDPGLAMITGLCQDIGKIKVPILRGLAGRAPYFHNGSAASLLEVINFYDQRFAIGFTDKDKQDLVNFLNSL